MEGEILKNLNFKVTVPSSFRFGMWYSKLSSLST
jgi:hypothetical protein